MQQLPATDDVAEEVESSEVSSPRASSESTTDSEVEGHTPAHRRIKDTPDSAVKYHSASTLRRCATKLPALLITLFLELIPALIYSNGYSLLEPYIGEEKSNLFIALNSLVAAVAGNFALQNSSNMSRAISIGIITKDRWMGHAFKEFLLGCVLSVELGVLFFVITGFIISPILFHGEVDATLGGVLALVFIVSTTIGSFSGLITPPVLYFFLRLDPSACAGPGETCFQDVVGSVVMVYMAQGVFALVFAFYIVSRDGSLLYDYESLTAEQRPSANDKIRWSSTFHTLSAIAASLSPTLPASGHGSAGGGGSKLEYLNPRGIKTIRGDSYSVHCMTVISGTKGFAVCAPAFPESVAQELLAQIFIYFCDYVMKNPFYELGMPARCKQFDDRVQQLLGKYDECLANGMRLFPFFQDFLKVNVLRVITQPGSVDVSALLFEEDRGSPAASAADGKERQEILPDGCVQSEGPSQRKAYGSSTIGLAGACVIFSVMVDIFS